MLGCAAACNTSSLLPLGCCNQPLLPLTCHSQGELQEEVGRLREELTAALAAAAAAVRANSGGEAASLLAILALRSRAVLACNAKHLLPLLLRGRTARHRLEAPKYSGQARAAPAQPHDVCKPGWRQAARFDWRHP